TIAHGALVIVCHSSTRSHVLYRGLQSAPTVRTGGSARDRKFSERDGPRTRAGTALRRLAHSCRNRRTQVTNAWPSTPCWREQRHAVGEALRAPINTNDTRRYGRWRASSPPAPPRCTGASRSCIGDESDSLTAD